MRLNDYRCAVCGHTKRDHEGEVPPKCPHCKDRPIMWKIYPKVQVDYKGPGFTGAQKDER